MVSMAVTFTGFPLPAPMCGHSCYPPAPRPEDSVADTITYHEGNHRP
jgi:hypothetical protein